MGAICTCMICPKSESPLWCVSSVLSWSMPFLQTWLAALVVFTTISWACAQSDVVLPITNAWRYEQTSNLAGTNWQAVGFNDSSWSNGPALLYVEDNVGVTPRNTLLTIGRTAYYFRTHFQYTNAT